MIELAKYFRILFLSGKISRERFKAFCEDHIARLNGNNPGGIFTAELTAVTALYNAYYGEKDFSSISNIIYEASKEMLNKINQSCAS